MTKEFIMISSEQTRFDTLYQRHLRALKLQGLSDIIKAPKVQSLPDILTLAEVEQLIGAARKLRYRVFLLTTYSLGLRLGETLALEVGDIDAQRKQVHIRRGKGHKDRLAPLPELTCRALRALWKMARIRSDQGNLLDNRKFTWKRASRFGLEAGFGGRNGVSKEARSCPS
jgi:integrase